MCLATVLLLYCSKSMDGIDLGFQNAQELLYGYCTYVFTSLLLLFIYHRGHTIYNRQLTLTIAINYTQSPKAVFQLTFSRLRHVIVASALIRLLGPQKFLPTLVSSDFVLAKHMQAVLFCRLSSCKSLAENDVNQSPKLLKAKKIYPLLPERGPSSRNACRKDCIHIYPCSSSVMTTSPLSV